MRNFIIGLSISFFILSGIITFKALRIPINNTHFQTTPKELDPKEHSPKSENMLRKPIKKQVDSWTLDEDALSNKDKATQNIDHKSIIQERSDKNIDNKNQLNKKLKVDEQYASRLVYTIQIESRIRIEDAVKQFDFILRSLDENNLNLLRIEKIGKYYAVRLGEFESSAAAEKFLQAITPQLPTAIILKAYIKNERIIRLYE
jgi:hypothetical protein